MQKFAKSLILATVFVGMLSPAHGQMSDHIESKVSRYKSSLANKDLKAADAAAYEAWQAAEKELGDHKITGDLAMNYALIYARLSSSKVHNKKSKAFERAIALANLHSDNPQDMTLERHLEYLIFLNAAEVFSSRRPEPKIKRKHFASMVNALDKFGKRGTVFEADMEALKVSYFANKGDHESVVKSGKTATKLYDSLGSGPASSLETELYIKLGKSYFEQKEFLKSALALQEGLPENSGGKTTKHQAYELKNIWRKAWVELYDAGEIESAKAAGLCDCISLTDPKGRPIRVKSHMVRPSVAKTLEAIILFDVADDGYPENARLAAYSNLAYGKAIVRSIEKFRYTPYREGDDRAARKNIPMKMTFKLQGQKGEVIKPDPMIVLIQLTENLDLLENENGAFPSGGAGIVTRD